MINIVVMDKCLLIVTPRRSSYDSSINVKSSLQYASVVFPAVADLTEKLMPLHRLYYIYFNLGARRKPKCQGITNLNAVFLVTASRLRT